MTNWVIRGALAIVTTGVVLGGGLLSLPPRRDAGHFADADDPALVADGKHVYAARCASCHGRHLQGQPLWQLADADSARRAPAHDQTGHTWQHADEDLFHITKFGRFAATPETAVSYMPGFGTVMADGEMLAAIAFIKASWPIGLRVAQATLNPGSAGMPREAGQAGWTFPANCGPTATRDSAAPQGK